MDKKIEILTADTEKLRGTVDQALQASGPDKHRLVIDGHNEANALLDRIAMMQKGLDPAEIDQRKALDEKRQTVAAMRDKLLAQRRALETGMTQAKTEAMEIINRSNRNDFLPQAALVGAGVVGVGLATRAVNKGPDGKRERWFPWFKRQAKRVAAGIGILALFRLFKRGGGGGGIGAGNAVGEGTGKRSEVVPSAPISPEKRIPKAADDAAPAPAAVEKKKIDEPKPIIPPSEKPAELPEIPPEVSSRARLVDKDSGVDGVLWNINVTVLGPRFDSFNRVLLDPDRSMADQQFYRIGTTGKRYNEKELFERLAEIRKQYASKKPMIAVEIQDTPDYSVTFKHMLEWRVRKEGYALGYAANEEPKTRKIEPYKGETLIVRPLSKDFGYSDSVYQWGGKLLKQGDLTTVDTQTVEYPVGDTPVSLESVLQKVKKPESCVVNLNWGIRVLGPETRPPASGDAILLIGTERTPCTPTQLLDRVKGYAHLKPTHHLYFSRTPKSVGPEKYRDVFLALRKDHDVGLSDGD